jgi:hypothetical protein
MPQVAATFVASMFTTVLYTTRVSSFCGFTTAARVVVVHTVGSLREISYGGHKNSRRPPKTASRAGARYVTPRLKCFSFNYRSIVTRICNFSNLNSADQLIYVMKSCKFLSH